MMKREKSHTLNFLSLITPVSGKKMAMRLLFAAISQHEGVIGA